MERVVAFGNSGPGKTAWASAFARRTAWGHLDLDLNLDNAAEARCA